MAGVRLEAGQRVSFFGAVATDAADPVVVTVAGSASALPGTEPGSAKVTPFALYPAKGRATGGVRCQRFLRGEDVLLLAWVGPTPARAAAPNGQPVDLPALDQRRDGSGTPLAQAATAVAGPVDTSVAQA
jgi:DNA gyrase subunit A